MYILIPVGKAMPCCPVLLSPTEHARARGRARSYTHASFILAIITLRGQANRTDSGSNTGGGVMRHATASYGRAATAGGHRRTRRRVQWRGPHILKRCRSTDVQTERLGQTPRPYCNGSRGKREVRGRHPSRARPTTPSINTKHTRRYRHARGPRHRCVRARRLAAVARAAIPPGEAAARGRAPLAPAARGGLGAAEGRGVWGAAPRAGRSRPQDTPVWGY